MARDDPLTLTALDQPFSLPGSVDDTYSATASNPSEVPRASSLTQAYGTVNANGKLEQLQAADTTTLEPSVSSQNLVFERRGTRASEALSREAAQVSVGNEVVGKGKLMHTRIEEQIRERLEVEATDQGELFVRRITEVERRTYTSIVEFMWHDASRNEPLALEEDAAPAVEATRSEKCVDICCQSCVCSFTSPFTRQTRSDMIKNAVKAKEIMTPILQRGRAKGWGIFGQISLPVVTDTARVVWVCSELVLSLLAFILSVTSFSLGNNEAFNAIHLTLTILSTILAAVDGLILLRTSCRKCIGKCQQGGEDQPTAVNHDNSTDSEPKKCCGECLVRFKSISDFIRMITAEIILYPLLICDTFELVLGEGYKPGSSAEDIIGFILFIGSSVLKFLYVYILRLVVLGNTIRHVQRLRKPPMDAQASSSTDYDKSLSNAGFWFQVYFFFHVLAQMVAQMCMLIAIGAKIQYDNRHANDGDKIHASSYLWYMIISGYILPICGILTFFLVTYYWTQEFPIGICIDILSILQMQGCSYIFDHDESTEEVNEKVKEIARFVHYIELKKQFEDMRTKKFLNDKFAYPFRSPVIIALSIVYAAFQFAFILCAIFTVNDDGEREVVVLNGGGWVIFYIVAVIISVMANLYIFTVAVFWTAIIAVILTLIVLLIAFLIVGCVCACLGSLSSSNNDDDDCCT